MKIIEIEWLDSRQPNPSWQLVEDISAKVCQCSTIGYLVSRDEERLVVAQSVGDQGGQAAGVMTIPAACVTRIRTLSRGR